MPSEQRRAVLTAISEQEGGADINYNNLSTVQFGGLCPSLKVTFHDQLVKSRVEQKNNYKLRQYELRGKTEKLKVQLLDKAEQRQDDSHLAN